MLDDKHMCKDRLCRSYMWIVYVDALNTSAFVLCTGMRTKSVKKVKLSPPDDSPVGTPEDEAPQTGDQVMESCSKPHNKQYTALHPQLCNPNGHSTSIHPKDQLKQKKLNEICNSLLC